MAVILRSQVERVASTFGTGRLPSSEATQLTHNHIYGACLVTMQRNDARQVTFNPPGNLFLLACVCGDSLFTIRYGRPITYSDRL